MFTVYYVLAPLFGVLAVIVSVIGIKNPETFPGKAYGPLMAIGAVFAILVVAFVWRGGEKEDATIEHKESVQQVRDAVKAIGTGVTNPLPAGIRLP